MTTDTEKPPFNPADHLMTLKGKAYLEVKWRVVWFREDHPDGFISTELVEHARVIDEKGKVDKTRSYAIFKATAGYLTERGVQVTATGYGSEEAGDFTDFAEKAETKALGRALASLGYGTSFCDDLDMGTKISGEQAVVDAPVAAPAFKPWGSS